MPTYINTGAYINGTRPASKAALKRALSEQLSTERPIVTFDQTSMFDGPGTIFALKIPAGVILSVVGPDPYTDRRWYASVSVSATGKLVVK